MYQQDSTFMQQTTTNQHMRRSIAVLFFVALFATLSFSVVYSTLILYITQRLGINTHHAGDIIATFIAFNYCLHILGGTIGGRYLSYRSAFCIGMVAMMVGCLIIAIPYQQALYWGLAAMLCGNGLNLTCVNCILTQLFHADDDRRETAFLWNYSGMNIGFLIGYALAGYFQLSQRFAALFAISSVGNFIALLIVLVFYKTLKQNNNDNNLSQFSVSKRFTGLTILALLFLILRWLISQASLSTSLVLWFAVVIAIIIIAVTLQYQGSVRHKLTAFCIFAIAALIYWTLYQLMPISLVLFIEHNVKRHFASLTIAPQWIQNVNSVIIIIGGPLLAMLFQQMRKRGYNVNVSLQFSLSLILIGIAMLLLRLGITLANPQGLVDIGWVALSYAVIALSELCLSPIGFAMIGRLVPEKWRGLFMGTWLMLVGVGGATSNLISESNTGENSLTNPLSSNPLFAHTFNQMGYTSLAAGIILLCATPIIYRKLLSR